MQPPCQLNRFLGLCDVCESFGNSQGLLHHYNKMLYCDKHCPEHGSLTDAEQTGVEKTRQEYDEFLRRLRGYLDSQIDVGHNGH